MGAFTLAYYKDARERRGLSLLMLIHSNVEQKKKGRGAVVLEETAQFSYLLFFHARLL